MRYATRHTLHDTLHTRCCCLRGRCCCIDNQRSVSWSSMAARCCCTCCCCRALLLPRCCCCCQLAQPAQLSSARSALLAQRCSLSAACSALLASFLVRRLSRPLLIHSRCRAPALGCQCRLVGWHDWAVLPRIWVRVGRAVLARWVSYLCACSQRLLWLDRRSSSVDVFVPLPGQSASRRWNLSRVSYDAKSEARRVRRHGWRATRSLAGQDHAHLTPRGARQHLHVRLALCSEHASVPSVRPSFGVWESLERRGGCRFEKLQRKRAGT